MDDIGLFEAMHTQLSARGYTDEEVTDEQIGRIIEAATWAPNAANRQLWEFIIVRDAEMRTQLADLYRKSYDLLGDSIPRREEDAGRAKRPEDATRWARDAAARAAAGDPRTQPKTMLAWSDKLAKTLQDVPVLIVVGYDRAGMPYSWDGIFGTFTRETVYTGVFPAIQNLMLAARGIGLGTCLTTVANIYEGRIKEVLGVPDSVQLVALLPLGYPTRPFAPRERIPWQEKVHWNHW